MKRKLDMKAIYAEIKRQEKTLKKVAAERDAVRGHYQATSPKFVPLSAGGPRARALGGAPARQFKLLAQGDSWFDYFPGTDLIDCLHEKHGHRINNIGVGGSTLNDEAYGPVPRELLGLKKQSDDPSRIAELVRLIREYKPEALLLSGGGNDIAGSEFFSFVNNAGSGLPPVNDGVLKGVLNETFKTAYEYLLDASIAAASDMKITMPIFVHGYDYPWPDGRGIINVGLWKLGPWFDETLAAKNYPRSDLNKRRAIVGRFIDELNGLLAAIAADPKYVGKVFHVKLVGTLTKQDQWANELHPRNDGFALLAAKFDASLQANI